MKRAIILITAVAGTVALANGQTFSNALDFESDAVGSDPNPDDGSVWITASWWPNGSSNCSDGTVVANGSNAVILERVPNTSCNNRPGVIVGSGSMGVGNGIMGLNFQPGRYPDIVSFSLFQFAVTNTGTITAYDENNTIIDMQTFSANSESITVSSGQPIARIEVANADAFTLDDLSWSGTTSNGSFNKTIDFDQATGSISGNYGLVQFRATAGYECGTGNSADGTSPLNGTGCLVLDGANPNNDPDDGCSNIIHGVKIAGHSDQNFAGTIGAFFHPGARPNTVSFDVRQYATAGPVNITAYDGNGDLVFSQTITTGHIAIQSPVGLNRVEIEGLYPFTVDDFVLSGQSNVGPCAADFNGDGTLDFFDVQAFLNAFATGCP